MGQSMSKAVLSLQVVSCLLFFMPNHANTQTVQPPHCEIADSLMAYAPGIEEIMHAFGSDTSTYPNEFDLASSFPAFAQVFELLLTDSVSGRWTQNEWAGIIGAVMSNDTTDTTDDVFGLVWSYFVRDEADSNTAHAGVRYKVNGVTYTKIVIRLYETADLPSSCPASYGVACRAGSSYVLDRLLINASSSQSESAVLGLGIAHELQHLCFKINGGYGYNSINETLSTLAEYFVDSWRDLYYDIPYDASILRSEPCDADDKYQVERMWISYLYEVFKGNAANPTDDLIYRWIRNDANRLEIETLEYLLWDVDFDWVGGVDAADRFTKVIGNYLVAKFCNAPNFLVTGDFGIGPLNTFWDFGLYQDNCDWKASGATPYVPDCPDNLMFLPDSLEHDGCWNVRIVLPEYTIGSSQENSLVSVTGLYEDGDAPLPTGDGDGSKDYIEVYSYGTDYIVFRPDSYFKDGDEHELRVRLGGKPRYTSPPYSESSRIRPIGWVMGYSTDSDTLQVHPESLVFVEPITFSPATTVGDTVLSRTVTVTDFGRGIKAVVVAVGNLTDDHHDSNSPANAFRYEYQYGVLTPGASTRAWDGDVYVTGDVSVPENGTLEIDAGTYVKIFPSDLAEEGLDTDRIEINVDGELVVNGTQSEPVTFHPWAQTTSEDWAGIYFSDESEGGTFNYCTIGYAEYVIDSYAPITIRNSTIRGASEALISMWDDTLTVENSTIRLTNGDCIRLDNTVANIDSTTIEDYFVYGVYADGNYPLNITNCEFLGDSIAVYVSNNSTNGVIANSTFQDNHTAISYYTSVEPDIDECVITNNNVGVRCDYYSSPTIEHCITSASYSGAISENGIGIFCTDHSDPGIGSCSITGNETGVGASDDSEPALQGYGANKLMSNSDYHVVNLTPGVTINARINYWYQNTGSPNYYPKSTKILGSVDYANALGSGPNPTSPGPMPDPEPAVVTALGRAHPNPFNPTIQIPYSLKEAMDVEIEVFDVGGRLVRTLVDGRKDRGRYVAVWDGVGNRGTPTATAVYFVRMRAGSYVQTQKILLLK